jgi:uncharacterized membrane protein
MVVHLPIVMIVLWPIIDAVGLWRSKRDLSHAGLVFLLFGFLSALLGMVTGQQAFDAAVAAHADPELLNTHADKANPLPWLLLVVLVVRTLGVIKLKRAAHVAAIVLGVALWPWIWLVGSTGGALVFEHAVGVQVDARHSSR